MPFSDFTSRLSNSPTSSRGRGSRGGRRRAGEGAGASSAFHNSDYLYYMNESGSRSGAFLGSAAASAAAAAGGSGSSGSPHRHGSGGGPEPFSAAAAEMEEDQLFVEKYTGKACALCNLVERSFLGQAEMVQFKVSPDVDLKELVARRKKELGGGGAATPVKQEDSDGDDEPLSERSPSRASSALSVSSANARRKGRKMTSGEQPSEPTVDELDKVGYTEEPDHSLLFEASGRMVCLSVGHESHVQ